jgi:hypothetical protein
LFTADDTFDALIESPTWCDKDDPATQLCLDDEGLHLINEGDLTGNGSVMMRFRVYDAMEDDIKVAWSGKYPGKPFPLVACDDDPMPDPGVVLAQARGPSEVDLYYFNGDDGTITEWGSYIPIAAMRLRKMRSILKAAFLLLKCFDASMTAAYAPGGAGYKRARAEFENACADY